MLDTINRYVMVFKYADGGSLRSYLSDPSIELDWPTKCKLGIDVANGMRYLHGHGIIHKDLVIIDVRKQHYTFGIFYDD